MLTLDELLQIIDKAAREGVTEINLSDRGLTTSPPEMARLSHLTGIDLSYNQLTRLPDAIAHTLDQYFQSQGITIIRDIRDLKFKASAREFMEWLGRGKCIITVISDDYLRKRSCMYELGNIAENAHDNEALRDRIFPIVLPSAKIYDVIDSMDYVSYWDEKIEALDTKLKQLKSSANLPRAQAELNLYTKIRAIIDTLTATLYDMKTINLEMEQGVALEDCLRELLQAVEQKISA